MNHPVTSPPPPAGTAFPLAELEAARGFAALRGWGFAIRLDHGGPGEEYEEVVALDAPGTRRWWLWRSAEHLMLRDQVGRTRRFVRMAQALAAIAE